jgi:hypothetical protein
LLDLTGHPVGDGCALGQLSQLFKHSRHLLASLSCGRTCADLGQLPMVRSAFSMVAAPSCIWEWIEYNRKMDIESLAI